MKVPSFLSTNSPWRKVLLALVIAIAMTVIAIAAEQKGITTRPGYAFYEWFFRQRPIEDRSNSTTVVITIDEKSLAAFKKVNHFGWPWPRDLWVHLIHYLQSSGARCVAMDILFPEESSYKGKMNDDKRFAAALDSATIPVLLATAFDNQLGDWTSFAPPVQKPPRFGVTSGLSDERYRSYSPVVSSKPSLGLAALQSISASIPDWAASPFWLHYYGPERDPRSGQCTFRLISAANVIQADYDPKHDYGVRPEDFRNKIVLVGGSAVGTYDPKVTPLGLYPGVEVHATAIENMLFNQRVRPVGLLGFAAVCAATSFAGAIGGIFPRRMWVKLLVGVIAISLLLLLCRHLFVRSDIRWLNPSGPLLAVTVSFILTLGWSYLVEDRQARFFIRALSQCVSPGVAEELRNDPSKLSISTNKRELTILFSDIAGFTTLSERLGEQVGALLNYYLDQMSKPVIASDGYLDKYIGDALMCFWNAPVIRADHADRACAAALAMQARLREIQPHLADLGAPGLSSRIGVNTGIVTFGMMGSSYKFNYSVIGDPVNFASRLEGANKFYRSNILVGETTADIVRDRFVLRRLDLLRVEGKVRPTAVFQLLAHAPASPALAGLVQRFEAAFRMYLARDWSGAEQILLDVLREFADDGPSQVLLARATAFRNAPPPPDWDGVYVAQSK